MKVRLLLIVLIASLCACTSEYNDSDKEISFMQFTELAKNDKIEMIIHDGQTYQVFFNYKGKVSANDEIANIQWEDPDKWFLIPAGDEYIEEFQVLSHSHNFSVNYEPINNYWEQLFSWLLVVILLIFLPSIAIIAIVLYLIRENNKKIYK